MLVEMFEKASGSQESVNLSTILPGYSIRNIESIKKEMTNAIADAYLKNCPSDNACTSPALQPAFEYIHSHKSEQVTLN
nr:hypothetical protein [Paenibacillus polymyxa]